MQRSRAGVAPAATAEDGYSCVLGDVLGRAGLVMAWWSELWSTGGGAARAAGACGAGGVVMRGYMWVVVRGGRFDLNRSSGRLEFRERRTDREAR